MARAKPKSEAKEGKPASEQPQQEYTPTPREAEALAAFTAARQARKPSPKLTIEKTAPGAFGIGVDHKDRCLGQVLLMQAIGTTDFHFAEEIMFQAANAGKNEAAPNTKDANFMIAVVEGIAPRDQVETMLAMQMAATHLASMTFARRLANVETIQQQDSAANAFNKLQRTFTTQMQALKNYRSTGQQKVTVEHVTVQSGGQAIVGNVSHGNTKSDAGQTPSVALQALSPPAETPMPLLAGGGVEQEKVRAIP